MESALRERVRTAVTELEGVPDEVLTDYAYRTLLREPDRDALHRALAVLLPTDQKAQALATTLLALRRRSHEEDDDAAGSGTRRDLAPPPSTSLGMSLRGSASCAPLHAVAEVSTAEVITRQRPPPPSLSDPELSVSDREQLHVWLEAAARQLYGRRGKPRSLLAGAARVLSNSQLASAVFRAIEAHDVADARRDGALGALGSLGSLPPTQRALLTDEMLEFLRGLLRALKEDDPETARSLLAPPDDASSSMDMEDAAAMRSVRISAATRRWVEERVVLEQGFYDQVVIDSLCRCMEGGAEVDYAALRRHAALLLDGDADAFVDSLAEHISSSRAADAESEPSATNGRPPASAAVASEHQHQPLLLRPLDEGLLVVTRNGAREGAAWLKRRGNPGLDRLASPECRSALLTPLHAAWPAPGASLLHVGTSLMLLRASGEPLPVATLPPRTRYVDAAWPAGGDLTVVALADAAVADAAPGAPFVWPPPARRLFLFTRARGWVDLLEVEPGSRNIAVAEGGSHCGWCAPPVDDSSIGLWLPRSEIFACELQPGAKPHCVSTGLGWCQGLAMAPNGRAIVYHASYSGHGGSALFLIRLRGSEPPLCLSPFGASVLSFGWAPSAEPAVSEAEQRDHRHHQQQEGDETADAANERPLRLWATVLRGVASVTLLLDQDGSVLAELEMPAHGSPPVWADGRCILSTESIQRPASLWDGAALTRVPQPMAVDVHVAQERLPLAGGGLAIAAVYSPRGVSPASATPLVVLLDGPLTLPMLPLTSCVLRPGTTHGGEGVCSPLALVSAGFCVACIHVEAALPALQLAGPPGHRAEGADSEPLPAASGCAAVDELVAVTELLLSRRPPAARGLPVGLVGKGDGAHLVLLALALTDRFAASVVWGGYVCADLRQMETGLPPPESLPAVEGKSLLVALPQVRAPTLLLCPADDACSPVSHARIVYRALSSARVESNLVTYPRLRATDQGARTHTRVWSDATARAQAWMKAHLDRAK